MPRNQGRGNTRGTGRLRWIFGFRDIRGAAQTLPRIRRSSAGVTLSILFRATPAAGSPN